MLSTWTCSTLPLKVTEHERASSITAGGTARYTAAAARRSGAPVAQGAYVAPSQDNPTAKTELCHTTSVVPARGVHAVATSTKVRLAVARSTGSPPTAANMLAANTGGQTTLAAAITGATTGRAVGGLTADGATTADATLGVAEADLGAASPSTLLSSGVADGMTMTTRRTLRG